jgi:hypothetical protein
MFSTHLYRCLVNIHAPQTNKQTNKYANRQINNQANKQGNSSLIYKPNTYEYPRPFVFIQVLLVDDFISIYQQEIDQGKYWGVEHDLGAVTGSGMAVENAAPFTMRFDRIFATTETLECLAVTQPLSNDKAGAIFKECTDVLPCAWHPSDHLPIAALLTFK